MVRRLDDRFRLLAGGRRGTRRQQTLHAALDWSHACSARTSGSCCAGCRRSPAPSRPTPRTPCAGCPGAFDLLRSLARKSLVVIEDDGPERRFRLLETVRAYARSDSPRWRRRSRSATTIATTSSPGPSRSPGADLPRSARLHQARRTTCACARAWSEVCGRRDLVARLAGTMSRVWVADIGEGRRWLSTGLEAVDELEAEHRVRTLAVAAQVAVLAMEAGDGALARRAVAASDGTSSLWSAWPTPSCA